MHSQKHLPILRLIAILRPRRGRMPKIRDRKLRNDDCGRQLLQMRKRLLLKFTNKTMHRRSRGFFNRKLSLLFKPKILFALSPKFHHKGELMPGSRGVDR